MLPQMGEGFGQPASSCFSNGQANLPPNYHFRETRQKKYKICALCENNFACSSNGTAFYMPDNRKSQG
jgi:hypothetical protein